MVSKLMRRSGTACRTIFKQIGFNPDVMYLIGVGMYHQEVDVLLEGWPEMSIYAFEPHPDIANYMEDNGFPGWFYRMAVGNECCQRAFHTKAKHKDGSTLIGFDLKKSDRDTYKKIYVEVVTLDGFCKKPKGKHNLLWIDCEGSEMAVLEGGVRFLEGVEVVNVELTSNPPGTGWADPVDVHDWLVEHGFLRQGIHTQRIGASQYDAVYVRTELFDPKYSICPYSTKAYWKHLEEKG